MGEIIKVIDLSKEEARELREVFADNVVADRILRALTEILKDSFVNNNTDGWSKVREKVKKVMGRKYEKAVMDMTIDWGSDQIIVKKRY